MEGRRRSAAASERQARRLGWLAAVDAVLAEAAPLLDALAAEGVATGEAARSLADARAALRALRARLRGSMAARDAGE